MTTTDAANETKPAEPAAQTTTVVKALPEAVSRRGVNEAQWNALCKSLYPGANPVSVLNVIDYCKARNLDPMKKPCHIVPMRVKDAKTDQWEWRDVVMPGIYEYRTTAQRTGEYLGHTEPEYGPTVKYAGVDAPEWCAITVNRLNVKAGQSVPFPVKVFFKEVVGTKKEGGANERWARAPIQMLTKCTEAAGLREAFPEEIGGEPTAEEMDREIEKGDRVQQVAATVVEPIDEFLSDLPDTEQAEIHNLIVAAKLTKGQLTTLLKKHENDPKGFKAAISPKVDKPAEVKTGTQVAEEQKPSPTAKEQGRQAMAPKPVLTGDADVDTL